MKKRHAITAIIYDKRGRVLSIGQNSYTDSIRLQRKHATKVGLPEKKFNHAEVVSVAKCRDLSKAHTIKVFRYNSQGLPVNAKPCPICMDIIKEVNIKKIEWTTEGGFEYV